MPILPRLYVIYVFLYYMHHKYIFTIPDLSHMHKILVVTTVNQKTCAIKEDVYRFCYRYTYIARS